MLKAQTRHSGKRMKNGQMTLSALAGRAEISTRRRGPRREGVWGGEREIRRARVAQRSLALNTYAPMRGIFRSVRTSARASTAPTRLSRGSVKGSVIVCVRDLLVTALRCGKASGGYYICRSMRLDYLDRSRHYLLRFSRALGEGLALGGGREADFKISAGRLFKQP
jgi:hypothetical protein